MVLAHAGVGVFIVGVTLVRGFEVQHDVKMSIGDTATAGGYAFVLESIEEVKGPNYVAVRARMRVSREGGTEVAVMHPEKRLYKVQQMPMTEAAIDAGITRDLYVSLGEPLSETAWIVRIYLKPFVDWIWAGALLMALGGLLAASDRRYRLAAQVEPPLAPVRAAPRADTGSTALAP